jgi:hypothetical protein
VLTAAVFIVNGAVYLAAASALGLPGFPLGWMGVSTVWVGLSYAMGRPAMAGKRADGGFTPWAIAIAGPVLFLVWLAWGLRRLRSERCWDEVRPGLFLGRRALPAELPPGIRLVADLTCELSEPIALRRLEYRCLPTLDGGAPEREAFVRLVREIAAFDGPVYVHCAAGHGRSATVVLAVLLARGAAKDVAAAEEIVRTARPGMLLSRAQRALLRETAAELSPVAAAA